MPEVAVAMSSKSVNAPPASGARKTCSSPPWVRISMNTSLVGVTCRL